VSSRKHIILLHDFFLSKIDIEKYIKENGKGKYNEDYIIRIYVDSTDVDIDLRLIRKNIHVGFRKIRPDVYEARMDAQKLFRASWIWTPETSNGIYYTADLLEAPSELHIRAEGESKKGQKTVLRKIEILKEDDFLFSIKNDLISNMAGPFSYLDSLRSKCCLNDAGEIIWNKANFAYTVFFMFWSNTARFILENIWSLRMMEVMYLILICLK